MCILCKQSIRLFQQKLWYKLISPYMHYLYINKMHQELQRAITQTELAPSPYILIQMFILWMSMCLQSLMKNFHQCLFKILRKNQNGMDKELQRAITLKELAPSPYFSIIKVHVVDINVFVFVMKSRHCLFKILKNLNIAHGQMPRRMDVKTVYPLPCKHSLCVCGGGYNNVIG